MCTYKQRLYLFLSVINSYLYYLSVQILNIVFVLLDLSKRSYIYLRNPTNLIFHKMCASNSVAYVRFKSFNTVRNHVKLEIRSFVMTFNSRGVFFKGTVLYGRYWLWVCQKSRGLQTCIARRLKVPNG